MRGERKTKNPTACLKTRHNQLSNDLTKMPHLVSKGRVPENTHTPTTNEIKILEGRGVKDSGNSEGERACLIDLVTRCLCPFVCTDCNFAAKLSFVATVLAILFMIIVCCQIDPCVLYLNFNRLSFQNYFLQRVWRGCSK